MIQSPISLQQSPLSAASEDEESNFQDLNHDEKGYLNEDDQYDDEEQGHFPIRHSHLPSQQTKEKLLLQEKLKERNKNKQNIKNQIHPLIFSEVTNPPIFMKKLSNLSRPKSQVRCVCYISQRNILLVILEDYKTINIYSTMNFNLIAVRKSKGKVSCLSYSKFLEMIIAGGSDNLLQLWSPRTFEVEAQYRKKSSNWLHSVAYVPKANIIIAKNSTDIQIFNTRLKLMSYFSLPLFSEGAQIQAITKYLLLASVCFEKQKRMFLLNLKTNTRKEFTKIFVPRASCVERTENSPQHIFSCLAVPEETPAKDLAEWHPFNLTQFTIDPKTEEFSIVRKTSTTHSLSKLSRLENSKYFLAQRFTIEKGFEMFMLSIQKDKVEIVKILSRPSSQIILNKIGIYLMIKEGSIVEVNDKAKISVYGYDFVKKKIEGKEPIKNSEE